MDEFLISEIFEQIKTLKKDKYTKYTMKDVNTICDLLGIELFWYQKFVLLRQLNDKNYIMSKQPKLTPLQKLKFIKMWLGEDFFFPKQREEKLLDLLKEEKEIKSSKDYNSYLATLKFLEQVLTDAQTWDEFVEDE